MKSKETPQANLENINYDFVEYYVGMAKMVVYWHVKALGFKVIAYSGPEHGNPESCSYLIVKNNIKLIITSASQPSSYRIVSYVDLHGNGIKRVGIHVDDVEEYFENCLSKGAIPIDFPKIVSDMKGTVTIASLKLFDDNELVLINSHNYEGEFMPGYINIEEEWNMITDDSELIGIDHIACALRINEIGLWEKYLNNILQAKTIKKFDERQIGDSNKIGMYLKVLQTNNKKLNKVLVEPDRNKKTQIQSFIDQNYGSGIQHIAFSSSNIIKSVELLRNNGVKFNSYPESYYSQMKNKYPKIDFDAFQKYGILCDVNGDSLLLQVFTSPIGDRPTFFYEIVQRINDYQGFGLENINALFKAMEYDIGLKKNINDE